MKTFPMFLKTEGRRIVIVGGGEQAAQKTRPVRKTSGVITIAAPKLDPELDMLVTEGAVHHHDGPIDPGLFDGAALVFVATGCRGADAAISLLAGEKAGAVVNVIDAPDLCDAFTPSIVDRDPVVVAIGTEGAAPVLARQIKSRMEQLLEPRLGALVAHAGAMRDRVAMRLDRSLHRAFWRWVFTDQPRAAHARGDEAEAERLIADAVERGGPGQATGRLSIIGTGPGAPDLVTLRAVQRLQEADVIHAAPGVGDDILELARRDAERLPFDPSDGSAWRDAVAGAATRQMVIALPGDGFSGERMAGLLETASVVCEHVPGLGGSSS